MRSNSILISLGVLIILSAISCTEDRFLNNSNGKPNLGLNTALPIRINEVVAKGSLLNTDLGNTSDWLELYNASASSFTMNEGMWYVTDNISDKEKFELPQRTISPGDFLVLFCDDSNRVTQQIHTNFGLSSGGESIFLFYKNGGQIQLADSMSFGPQEFDNMSTARIPDGSPNWVYPINPTPGNSNQ